MSLIKLLVGMSMFSVGVLALLLWGIANIVAVPYFSVLVPFLPFFAQPGFMVGGNGEPSKF
ncbi:MAG: hypothetical protein ACYSTI_14040, partial [Planctomycetota bacterium]